MVDLLRKLTWSLALAVALCLAAYSPAARASRPADKSTSAAIRTAVANYFALLGPCCEANQKLVTYPICISSVDQSYAFAYAYWSPIQNGLILHLAGRTWTVVYYRTGETTALRVPPRISQDRLCAPVPSLPSDIKRLLTTHVAQEDSVPVPRVFPRHPVDYIWGGVARQQPYHSVDIGIVVVRPAGTSLAVTYEIRDWQGNLVYIGSAAHKYRDWISSQQPYRITTYNLVWPKLGLDSLPVPVGRRYILIPLYLPIVSYKQGNITGASTGKPIMGKAWVFVLRG